MKLLKSLDHALVATIEEHKYLRTIEILPVFGNFLELHFGAGFFERTSQTVSGIDGCRPIDIDPRASFYSLKFINFVSYSVTDEMFSQSAEHEAFSGLRLRSYSKSHFLDFINAKTWATADFPGELLHYQLNTLDHTIDVVTAVPPDLVQLQRDS